MRYSCLIAGSRPKLFHQPSDHRLGFCQQNVFLKGVLNRDGLGGSVRYDLVLVDASRKFVEAHTVPTKFAFNAGQSVSS